MSEEIEARPAAISAFAEDRKPMSSVFPGLGGKPRGQGRRAGERAAEAMAWWWSTANAAGAGRGRRVHSRCGVRAGMDLPFACKGGMCSTCRAHLTKRRCADGKVNYSLEPWS